MGSEALPRQPAKAAINRRSGPPHFVPELKDPKVQGLVKSLANHIDRERGLPASEHVEIARALVVVDSYWLRSIFDVM